MPDPVKDSEFVAWYYAPAQGKTQGAVCLYCGRSWYSKYRVEYPKLVACELECGKVCDLSKALKAMAEWLIQKCVAAGARNIHISFGDCPARVVSSQRQGVEVYDEDDQVELNQYIRQWNGGMGDPSTHGLNHRVGWLNGVWGVFVPGAPVQKVRRIKGAYVATEKVHDDGTMQLSTDQLQETVDVIMKGFEMARATEAHAGLLGGLVQQGQNATEHGAPGSASSALAASGNNFFGMLFATLSR